MFVFQTAHYKTGVIKELNDRYISFGSAEKETKKRSVLINTAAFTI